MALQLDCSDKMGMNQIIRRLGLETACQENTRLCKSACAARLYTLVITLDIEEGDLYAMCIKKLWGRGACEGCCCARQARPIPAECL